MLATAERYLLTWLRTRLLSTARLLHDAYWVLRRSIGSEEGGDGSGSATPNGGTRTGEGRREGKVFIFNNGSFTMAASCAKVGSFTEPEAEELEFTTDPSQKTRLQGDLIIVRDGPQPPHLENVPNLLLPSVFPPGDSPGVLCVLPSPVALNRSLCAPGFTQGLPLLHVPSAGSREDRKTGHELMRSHQEAGRAAALPPPVIKM
ncbi:hypothetical protein F5148DRAFT_1380484 [Russula earlei]|uniref:Uncharacterized protein n=1 Tax=Russula earlei TaxID=71964 RepID=A0ACC0TQY0_9AGAM|nr:hypothetical protein F5148DRAFT_1380484 [Russula earlei]